MVKRASTNKTLTKSTFRHDKFGRIIQMYKMDVHTYCTMNVDVCQGLHHTLYHNVTGWMIVILIASKLLS